MLSQLWDETRNNDSDGSCCDHEWQSENKEPSKVKVLVSIEPRCKFKRKTQYLCMFTFVVAFCISRILHICTVGNIFYHLDAATLPMGDGSQFGQNVIDCPDTW